MEEIQYVRKLIEIKGSYDIERYKKINQLHFTPFEGTPKKHPSDESVIILFTNPFAKVRSFYEFPLESIAYIEELGTITAENGTSVYTIRVWVKKGMPALKSEPFIVE